eukprot:TRINITY_DN11305_c0_g1_i1.p3 TRINITY_DN11305_c0_g1~~TRINITY_DN11305_c0_g1_i1.p3  ORF type:complete len:104 (-),score=21.99 TRINITY_DN11305_c0_g1_i1:580-891(-)
MGQGGGVASGVAEAPPSRVLYVSGLPPDASESDLHPLFSSLSGFEHLQLVRYKDSGKARAAFVYFTSVQESHVAKLTLAGAVVRGMPLIITFSLTEKQTTQAQ